MRVFIWLILFIASSVPAFASDVYFSSTAQGANTGADCADSYAYNDATHGLQNSAAYGAGITDHLCGTFTASPPASSFIVFQGGGSSGNEFELKFETGALITATYWTGGVIDVNGQSHVVIDGGTNGTIQATQNGSAFVNQADYGTCVQQHVNATVTDVTIKNLVCANIYVDSSLSDNGGQNTYGFDMANTQNLTIENTTIHDTNWAVRTSYAVGSTYSSPVLTMYGNTIFNMDHGYFMSDSNSSPGATASGWYIYSNNFGSMANWDNTADNNHHDVIYLNASSSSTRFSNFYIYNNQWIGDPGVYGNAWLYASPPNASVIAGVYAFNNLAANTSTSNCFADGFISWQAGGALTATNNTLTSSAVLPCGLFGRPGDNGTAYEAASVGLVMENNIVEDMKSLSAYINGAGTSISTIDHQDYYSGGGWIWLTGAQATLAGWQTACSCDANSILTNPNLNGSYVPNVGSPVIGAGENLYSFYGCSSQSVPGLGAACSDASGNARPVSGAWTMGAYNSVAAPGNGILLATPF